MAKRLQNTDPESEAAGPDDMASLAGEAETRGELAEAVETLMAESPWLQRRRPILGRLIDLAAGADTSDATQFRALNLILELMEKGENDANDSFRPTTESVREAVAILKRLGY